MQENRLIEVNDQYLNFNNQRRDIMYTNTGTRNS